MSPASTSPRRVLAIGLGPFNLSLAALAHPLPDVEVEVVESRDAFVWHPGMMLPGAQIQVPFLADLVTFADPTSPYSFLAYLKAMGRLHRFYIRGSWYPLRREFSDYCAWVAAQLPGIAYATTVTAVRWDDQAREHGRAFREGVVGSGRRAPRTSRTVGKPYLRKQIRNNDVTYSKGGLQQR